MDTKLTKSEKIALIILAIAIPLGFLNDKYELFARFGDKQEQINLGKKYQAEGNFDKANEWYRKASDQGSPEADLYLGDLYLSHDMPGHFDIAAEWYKKANQGEWTRAEVKLGQLYEYANRPGDLALAAQWYQKAAEHHDEQSTIALATLYRDGRGVPKDPARAASIVQWLIDKNSNANPYYAARVYELGLNGATDMDKAVDAYQRATTTSRLGTYAEDSVLSDEAKARLGSIYYFGQGVPADYGKAYQNLAHLPGKNAHAQFILGLMYQDGKGVTKDPVQACDHFNVAVRGYDLPAMYALAKCYETGTGQGITVNLNKAKQYMEVAAELENIYQAEAQQWLVSHPDKQ